MRDALPGASFIGFTGTPIEKADTNTQETFGGYVSVYDIEDAKKDKATVPIYYESRLAKLDINREEIDALNKDVEEVIEDEEDVVTRENTKGKWAQLSKLAGAEDRLKELAADLVNHYEIRIRALEGKAMFVARMRILIRQLLRKYKYPPEGYDEAIVLVLAQAQALADEWSGGN